MMKVNRITKLHNLDNEQKKHRHYKIKSKKLPKEDPMNHDTFDMNSRREEHTSYIDSTDLKKAYIKKQLEELKSNK